MLDEHISWRDHKRRILTGEIIQVLTGVPLKTIYFTYIHSYLNYANIAWAKTNVTKLSEIHLLQKQ